MKLFLSSTCYDLVDLRAIIENFFKDTEHSILLSERDNFPIDSKKHRHQICLDNIKDCDLYILVINSRYGSPFYKNSSISITHAEYREATKKKKPILVFVRESVFNERQTWARNGRKEDFITAFCDNINVFKFIDEIQMNTNGYWISPFDSALNIIDKLKSTKPIFNNAFNSKVEEDDEILTKLILEISLKPESPFLFFLEE